ncbi:MAG: metallophosphoesterase [Planctomycetaceae bacterium]|nr:metallophosphoesterase [Planctomycetaceae bacterium]
MKSRRYIVIVLTAALAFPALAAAAPLTITGRVFLDANGNGQFDAGEAPPAGAAVTDGVTIVAPDKEGKYSISVGLDLQIPQPSQVISVIWPSATWPVGTWWRRVDTLKAGQSVDFALRQDTQALPFVFAFASDPHDGGKSEHSEAFRRDVADLGCVKLGIFGGDYGYSDTTGDYAAIEASYTSWAKYMTTLPAPFFCTQGNHDLAATLAEAGAKAAADAARAKARMLRQPEPMVKLPPPPDRTNPLYAYGAYTKHLGPPRWSFSYGGVHFVGLDWATKKGEAYEEGVSSTAVKWLAEDLARVPAGQRILVFTHFPMGDEGLWPLLAKHKVTQIFAGHTHRGSVLTKMGVPALTVVNRNGPYKVVRVTENTLDIADRCTGCRSDKPGFHQVWCPLREPDAAAMKPIRTVYGKFANEKVSDDVLSKLAGFKTGGAEILTEIAPGEATRYGLQLTAANALKEGQGIEALVEDGELVLGGVRTPFKTAAGGSVKMHLIARAGVATLWVDGRVTLTTRYKPFAPVMVVLRAKGGQAVFRKLEFWELR